MTPEEAYRKVANENLSEEEVFDLECIIADDICCSYDYSFCVLKGRFPLGEMLIAKNGNDSLYYATKILRRRFKLGEKAIVADNKLSQMYKQFLESQKIK